MKRGRLLKKLDSLYRNFDFEERVRHDPIQFPRSYTSPSDIEVAGFIASSLAYGRVSLFMPVIEKILKTAGTSPSDFAVSFSPKRHGHLFNRISYRFNTERDIQCLIFILGRAIKKWGSLKDLFLRFYKPDHEDTREALTGFVESLLNINVSSVYGKNTIPPGLRQLIPSPAGGGACKRLNLFLRWMVRDRDIDMGIWKEVSPSSLIIPLDTHIAKVSRTLGLTERKSSDWKTAKEITQSLKILDPHDPLKYDFVLCHLSMKGPGFKALR